MGTQDIGSKVNRSNATLAGGGVDKRAVADTKLIHPAVFSMSLWGKAGAVAGLGLRLGDHRGARSASLPARNLRRFIGLFFIFAFLMCSFLLFYCCCPMHSDSGIRQATS